MNVTLGKSLHYIVPGDDGTWMKVVMAWEGACHYAPCGKMTALGECTIKNHQCDSVIMGGRVLLASNCKALG